MAASSPAAGAPGRGPGKAAAVGPSSPSYSELLKQFGSHAATRLHIAEAELASRRKRASDAVVQRSLAGVSTAEKNDRQHGMRAGTSGPALLMSPVMAAMVHSAGPRRTLPPDVPRRLSFMDNSGDAQGDGDDNSRGAVPPPALTDEPFATIQMRGCLGSGLLNLSNNELTAADVAALVCSTLALQCGAMTDVQLQGNFLTELPAALLQGARRATSLRLSNNRLGALTEDIDNLSRLRVLDLAKNKLRALPASLANITSLERLSAPFNQLATVPAALGRTAPQLVCVRPRDARVNFLYGRPIRHMRTLYACRYLNLCGNFLTALPDGLAWATALTSLNVAQNALILLAFVRFFEEREEGATRDAWLKHTDAASGAETWVNTATGDARREPPAHMSEEQALASPSGRFSGEAAAAASAARAPVAAAGAGGVPRLHLDRTLKAGWRERVDLHTGSKFWVDERTGEMTMDKPVLAYDRARGLHSRIVCCIGESVRECGTDTTGRRRRTWPRCRACS